MEFIQFGDPGTQPGTFLLQRPPSIVGLTVTDQDGRSAETYRVVEFTNPRYTFKPPGVFGISSGTTSPLLAPCPGEKKPAPQVSPPPKPSRLALAQGGTLAIAHGCPGVQACGATAVVSVASVASTPGDPCRRVQPGDPCRRVVSAQRRRRSRVTKATSFMIQPGKTRKVKLKLNRRGRSLLRRRRLRRVQVSYAPFTVGRKPRVTTRTLRVRRR